MNRLNVYRLLAIVRLGDTKERYVLNLRIGNPCAHKTVDLLKEIQRIGEKRK